MIWYERTVHIGGILTQIIVVVVIIIIIIIIIINIIIIIIIIIDDKVKRLGAIALSYPPFFLLVILVQNFMLTKNHIET